MFCWWRLHKNPVYLETFPRSSLPLSWKVSRSMFSLQSVSKTIFVIVCMAFWELEIHFGRTQSIIMKRGVLSKHFRQICGCQAVYYFKHQNSFFGVASCPLNSSTLTHGEHHWTSLNKRHQLLCVLTGFVISAA